MNPIAFRIGPFAVHWYGLLILAGALAGALVATREAKRQGLDPDHVWNGLLLILIFGLIGARLYHVFSSPAVGVGWEYYRQHPIEIVAFWRGGLSGLGIFGAVAGGIVGLYIYTRLNKLDFLTWLDVGAPSLILGQAIGRWGNFFNQELYGYPTNLPWGIYIDPPHRLPGFENYERFHPTFLYESLWNLIVFFLLIFVGRRWGHLLLKGDLFLLYGILYPLGRFFVEMQRPDAWAINGIPVAQLISVAAILICGGVTLSRHKIVRHSP